MTTQSVSSTSQKEYRMLGVWRFAPLLVLAMCIVFSLIFIVLLFTLPKMDNATRVVMMIGTLFFWVLGVLLFLGLRRVRLITSPQGIIFYAIGYRIYSPWDNIKGIGEGEYGGNKVYGATYQPSQQVEGLLLRKLAVPGPSIAEGIQHQTSVIEGNRLILAFILANIARYGNLIPLRGFVNDTVREELLADAKRYAPQNFQEAVGLHFSTTPIFQSEEG